MVKPFHSDLTTCCEGCRLVRKVTNGPLVRYVQSHPDLERHSGRSSVSAMDSTTDVQSPWPMPGVSFDFLDDIDEAAPLDLFGVVGPFDEAGSSGCTTSDAVPHIFAGVDTSKQDPLTLAPTQQKDRKTTVKELNKRAQKRFREKQKVSMLGCRLFYMHRGDRKLNTACMLLMT